MEAFILAALAAVTRSENIAVVVLMLVCLGLGYLHIVWRREEREDRRRLYDVVESQTRAVEALRITVGLFAGTKS